MTRIVVIAGLGLWAGCFTGAPAARAVNRAWVGHTSTELVARWGPPAARGADGPTTALYWRHVHTHVSLPEGGGHLAISSGPGGTSFDLDAAFKPGEIWHTTTEVAALVDPAGHIARVEGASLRWGPPNDANVRWGTLFGAHVGMGRLDTTPTPLPSGNIYIGGMLGPTLGLVGAYSLVAGTSDAGGALAMAASLGVQWWPVTRLSLRTGPALLLTLDPGFANAALRPGLASQASYAFVKVGRFALDLCFDLAAGPSTAFGTVGVGVNLN